ncbi:MAG: M20 family metallopeptidase [Kiritimatiellia bacterium]
MPIESEIKKSAGQFAGTLAKIRREIHACPEPGFKETRTCRKITGILKQIGLDRVIAPVARTGVIGLLTGRSPGGKTAALRADIDALPILEENNVPYKSRNRGMMHACGHDAHIAMCLGAAMILKHLRGRFRGKVKFIFQPAEERLDGAPAMIRAGALENPKVDAIFALHVMPEIEFGQVSCAPGPAWAAADRFLIEITGRGGHGAMHFKCIDPVLVASEVYSGLQSIERNLCGTDPRVISVCCIHGGSAFNIIPDRVAMEGTVRTFEKSVQATIIRRMREITAGICSAHGAKWKITYQKGVPATVNDCKMAALLRKAACGLGMSLAPDKPSMGGEDFSFFLQKVPGAIARIGVRTGKKMPDLHNSRFDAGDRILPLGAALLAKCALDAMEAS